MTEGESVDPGTVESTVLRDLAGLGKLDKGVRSTLAEMAKRLARAYDQDDGEDLSKLARLNMELRQTLTALTTAVAGDFDDGEAAHLSTPVRDGEEPGAADVGAAGGGGGGAAG